MVKKKSILYLMVISVLALSLTAYVNSDNTSKVKSPRLGTSNQLIINEIIPDNRSLYPNSSGDYYDIIEIYNGLPTAVNLQGYGLSDDPDLMHKWIFGDVVIEANDRLIVFASGKDYEEAMKKASLNGSDEIHCDFKLSKEGERLFFTDVEGHILSAISYEAMDPNMSYGWSEEGYTYYYEGTPLAANEGVKIRDIGEYEDNIRLEANIEPGIYSQPLELKFKTNSEYTLRYTVDGKDPDYTSSQYKGSIYIDYTDNLPLRITNIPSTYYKVAKVKTQDVSKGMVVKARYFKDKMPVGDTFIATYFVWKEGQQRYSFDVVSLSTDPDNLFQAENGIYVVGKDFLAKAPANPDGGTPANYNQRGRDWERQAYVEFFGQEGQEYLGQATGIRLFGGWSRANEKKSFKLLAREEYGKDVFDYDFFGDLVSYGGDQIDEFNRLILRSGANDYGAALFRDLITDKLASGLLDYQSYKQVILFINGEYYGIYHLREHLDENYLSAHYGVDKDQVSIVIYSPIEPELYKGTQEDYDKFMNFLAYIEQEDMTEETSYEYVSNRLDLENMINYYIVEIYVNNQDWPGNNTKLWRYTGEVLEDYGLDGKYRFLLYDTEFNFGLYEGPGLSSANTFDLLHDEDSTEWPNPNWSTLMYRKLMENEDFKASFITRFCDMLNSNLSKESVDQVIDDFEKLYDPEMEEYINRYSFWDTPDYNRWKNYQLPRLKTFNANRGTNLLRYAKKQYNLGDITPVIVKPFTDGKVMVNDFYRIDGSEEERRLNYYSDYKVILQAIADKGHEFSHWDIKSENLPLEDLLIQGDIYSEIIGIQPLDQVEITPIFQ